MGETEKEKQIMALGEQTYGFFMPPVSLMGIGCAKETGLQAKILGATKVLIVTDAGLAKLGVAKTIQGYLQTAGVAAVIFDGVEANPTEDNVQEGAKDYLQNQCDGVISIGGGSAHDCAKAIGVVTVHGGSIRDFAGVDRCSKPLPPLICVNTTAGTAAEMTRVAVITNPETHVKYVVADWRITPRVAINDPLLMVGLPPGMTAATGMDALTHAIEAYVSPFATPITDACALKAIELIGQYLRPAVANGQNLEARDKMAYAEFLAGMACSNAMLGYVHALAHQLGAKFNLPHGVCNAICLPVVCEFIMIGDPKKFSDVALALGENIAGLSVVGAAERGIAAMQKLSKDIGIPSSFAELGVVSTDVRALAEGAMKEWVVTPRWATVDELMKLFNAVLATPRAASVAS